MASVEVFKKFFEGASLEAEDIFLLEKFQIEYWPGWVPERELSAILWEYPGIKHFLMRKCPEISTFLDKSTAEFGPAKDPAELACCEETLVWTIADLLVYNKCPEIYDAKEFHTWDFSEVTNITSLAGKVIVEGGAGTGTVTVRIAQTASQVFAIEPVTRLREFIREKAKQMELENIFVLDGFLHAIPLPDDFADVFISSHALGWQVDQEVIEFERVVKPDGMIIHCPGTADSEHEDSLHSFMISSKAGYSFAKYQAPDGIKRKYWKQVS
jgi:ubiquinone/menaquinone biosynthesis C-methylase UbiE